MENNNNTENISRRGFLKSIVTIWFSVLSLPFIYAIAKYIELIIDKKSSIGIKNVFITFAGILVLLYIAVMTITGYVNIF
jgi:hypothetical protein